MPRIAISYRRSDSEVITGRIFDRLAAHYGRDAVFRDIDSIPAGVDFRQHINRVLGESDILLAIVGPRWLGQRDKHSRVNDEADPVRIEVETCLRKQMPVIPVLVMRAAMPAVAQLPESMRDFAYRNAVQVDAGRDFDVHLARLIRAMDDILQQKYEVPAGARDAVIREPSAVLVDAKPKFAIEPTSPSTVPQHDTTSASTSKYRSYGGIAFAIVAAVFLAALVAALLITALGRYPPSPGPRAQSAKYDGDYVGELKLISSANNDPRNCTMVNSTPILRIINGGVDVGWSANAHVAGPVEPDGSINLIGRHQSGSEVHFNAKIQGTTVTGQWQSDYCQVSFELHKKT
jgi:hypothetical protein